MIKNALERFGGCDGQTELAALPVALIALPSKVLMKRKKTDSVITVVTVNGSDCERDFDDLTGTIFAGHHQSLRVWILCLYFIGLNLSNAQIGKEFGLDADSAHDMATQLQNRILAKEPEVVLSGEVECDEVYIVARHKGNPEAVKKKREREGHRRRLKDHRGRGTLEKEKPPIFGMIQRSREVVIRMLAHVQQITIEPRMRATIAIGTIVYTGEYDIYSRVTQWGFEHHTVNHGRKEYARDDNGDEFCEEHVNTMEGFWSLLRSWLRPHRGISQEKLPNYLAFFQSFTTYENVEKLCCNHSSSDYSFDLPETPDEPFFFVIT